MKKIQRLFSFLVLFGLLLGNVNYMFAAPGFDEDYADQPKHARCCSADDGLDEISSWMVLLPDPNTLRDAHWLSRAACNGFRGFSKAKNYFSKSGEETILLFLSLASYRQENANQLKWMNIDLNICATGTPSSGVQELISQGRLVQLSTIRRFGGFENYIASKFDIHINPLTFLHNGTSLNGLDFISETKDTIKNKSVSDLVSFQVQRCASISEAMTTADIFDTHHSYKCCLCKKNPSRFFPYNCRDKFHNGAMFTISTDVDTGQHILFAKPNPEDPFAGLCLTCWNSKFKNNAVTQCPICKAAAKPYAHCVCSGY